MPKRVLKEDSSSNSSAEEDESKQNKKQKLSTPKSQKLVENGPERSSERIRSRRNRSFEMPNRSKILSAIKNTSPNKSLSEYRPRRIVNNFMKETHQYNRDPNYSEGDSESSIDDFINDDNDDDDDDDDGSSTDNDSTSSSDSDDSAHSSATDVSRDEKGRSPKKSDRKSFTALKNKGEEADEGNISISNKSKPKHHVIESDPSEEEDDEEMIGVGTKESPRCRRKRRITDVSSDEEISPVEHIDSSAKPPHGLATSEQKNGAERDGDTSDDSGDESEDSGSCVSGVSSISESSDIEIDGVKRSKRARYMKRKRVKKLAGFDELKKLRQQKLKNSTPSK